MKYLAGRLLMLAPIPLAMAAVSFTVDMARLFHGDREHEVVRLLNQGENVDVDIATIDERRLQRYFVESGSDTPDWVVFGSSRAMNIRRGMTTASTFHNHAVSRAVIEDVIGILGLYDRRGRLPAHVVLTVDAWWMNRLKEPPYWREIQDSYNRIADQAGIQISHSPRVLDVAGLRAAKAAELLSPTYFQACLRKILYESSVELRAPTAADSTVGERSKILTDGSLLYPRSKYSVTLDQTRTEIAMRSRALASTGDFDRTDDEMQTAFQRLVTFLRDRTDLTLVLVPFHPLEYERMIDRPGYSIAPTVEKSTRAFAAMAGVRLIGTYDPTAAGCDETEFFDASHARPSCLAKVMAPLRRADHGAFVE